MVHVTPRRDRDRCLASNMDTAEEGKQKKNEKKTRSFFLNVN